MDFMFKCLVAVILVLCLLSAVHVVTYYTNGSAECCFGNMFYNLCILPSIYMEARDITSEGPNGRTFNWYLGEALCRFDDSLKVICNTINANNVFKLWRAWLRNEFGITMY